MTETHLLTIAGAKGGVGKTTTSINLAASLSAAGQSAVVLELDLAMANLVDFLDVDIDEGATLHEVLAGDTGVEKAIYETTGGTCLVPSGTQLGGYAETDLDRLGDVVEQLRRRFDVILLDTPAGLSDETVRPMGLADAVVLVSTPRVASVRNVRNTLELAERVGVDVRGLVLTKSGTGASPGAQRIANFLDIELLGRVPEDDAVPHSQDNGRPVVEHAPNSGAAIAYRKIAAELPQSGERPTSDRSRAQDGPSWSEGNEASRGGDSHITPTVDDTATEETDPEVVERPTAVASTDGGDEHDGTGTEETTESADTGNPEVESSTATDAERDESETDDSTTGDDESKAETADSFVGKLRAAIGL